MELAKICFRGVGGHLKGMGLQLHKGEEAMKKFAGAILILTLVLGFGLAYAEDSRIPQELQAQYEQATGSKATFYI